MKNINKLKILYTFAFIAVAFFAFSPKAFAVTYSPTNTGPTGSIQTYTVPSTGNYTIEAWGAQGGGGIGINVAGGLGAYATGTVSLTAGDVLQILVGQQGGTGTSVSDPQGNENGGGGGTFVVKQSGSVPQVIAGGGGGGYSTNYGTSCTRTASDGSGSTSTSGTSINCVGVGIGSGGAGGAGGSTIGSYQGGAGGGFSTNGANGGTHCSAAIGGLSFTNGGTGGAGNSCYSSANAGGYGGGGGGQLGGPGAGGGYSGGGSSGSWSSYSTYGGGGGSYIIAGATGTVLTAGARSGAGQVIITAGGGGGTNLGYTSIGASWQGSSNRMRVSRVTVPTGEDGLVSQGQMYLDGATADATVYMVAYLGSGTAAPTTLLGVSNGVSVLATAAPAWVSFTFPTPFDITVGQDIWIGLYADIAGTTAGTAGPLIAYSGSVVGDYPSDGYRYANVGDAPVPGTFPAHTDSATQLSWSAYLVSVANTAPTITGQPAATYGSYTRSGALNNWTLGFTATDAQQNGANQLTYTVKTNGTNLTVAGPTAFTSGSVSTAIAYNAPNLSVGTNTLYVTISDGTLTTNTSTFNVLVDSVAPTASTTISTTPSTPTSNSYTVTFTPNDATSTNPNEISYKICTANDTCSSPVTGGTGTAQSGVAKTTGTLTDATGGVNNRWVRTCDGANNCTNTGFTFTAEFMPTVTTPTAGSFTGSSAVLGGTLASAGTQSVTDRGVCYSTVDTTPGFASQGVAEANVTCVSASAVSPFTINATGLTPNNTPYYYRAYAYNSVGYGYHTATNSTFNTATVSPSGVSTSTNSTPQSYYVTFNGNANPNGNPTYGHFRLFTANPGNCSADSGGSRFPQYTAQDVYVGTDTAPHDFSFLIPLNSSSFLVPNTTYYYCAYAVGTYNSTQYTSGGSSVITFITPDGPASPCDPPTSGGLTIPATAACSFDGTISGVDSGTGTRNTALLTLSAGATLTISAGQQISWGSIDLKRGSSISLAPGGILRSGAAYVHDSDGDNYLDDAQQYIGNSPPAGYRRRNLISSELNYAWKIASSGATFDCNSSSQYVYRSVGGMVTDADNDGYKTSAAAGTQCVGTQSTINGRPYYKDTSNNSSYLPDGQKLSSTADCLDTGTGGQGQAAASVYQNFTGYSDADNDNYTINSTASICSGASILAYNASTNPYRSTLSSPVDCQDNPNGTPCAPVNGSGTNGTNPTAAAASTTQINLAWGVNSAGGAVPAATGYDVQICGLNDTTCASYSTQSVSSVTYSHGDSGIACSTSPSYYYRIVAKHSTNGNTNSSIFSGVTSTCCTTGFKDYDGDTYGAGSSSCWNPSASYTVVATGTDCYDYDGANSTTRTQSAYAKPGQTGTYTVVRGAPANVNDWAGNSYNSYDYNCDTQYTNTLTNTTTLPGSMPSRTYCTGGGPVTVGTYEQTSCATWCSYPYQDQCCAYNNACTNYTYCSNYTTLPISCSSTYNIYSSGPFLENHIYSSQCGGGGNNVGGYYGTIGASVTVQCR